MDDQTATLGPGTPTPPLSEAAAWGPFRLLQRVGHGSFGEVYRAFDPALQREVAVKLLMRSNRGLELEEKALLQEARAVARVRHPNVVSVYGVDTHDGRVGFWSDFVNGKTLAAIVEADGPFGAREAALIGVDVCKAVGAVHAAGLLHRDIKSSNVMRESGGRILLMDFGLTHDREAAAHSGGTPLYMAPELVDGAPATVATDIYALGMLLFHLMTGKYPAQASASQTILDVRPDLPEALARVVDTAIDPNAQKRYQSAGQMIAALTDAVGLGSVRPEVAVAVGGSKPSRWWAAGAAAAVLAIALAVPLVRSKSVVAPIVSLRDDYSKAHDLVEHYYRPQALETAIPLLAKIVEKDPNFAPAFADLGRANMLQFTQLRDPKYLEPTRQASLHALSLKPDLATAHVTLGMLYTWTGKNDLASEELDQALKLDKFNAAAYAAQGNLLLRQGRNDAAQADLEKAVDLAPEDWGVVGQLASYSDEIGKYDQAAEQYQRAVALAPDNPRALNNLGLVYRKQGRLEEAEAAYRKSIALDPSASHYRNLGQTLLENGKAEEARSMLERAVSLKGDDYRSWGFLATAHAKTGTPASKVNEAYRKAIALTDNLRRSTPDSSYLFADLAGYYAALGMVDESESSLRRALAHSANLPEVLYEAAVGYELLHKREKALDLIERALEGGISPRFLERNLQLSELRGDARYSALIDRVRKTK